MPISWRWGIDRTGDIPPTRELVDSYVSTEPVIIESRADTPDTAPCIIEITSISTIGISDISDIAIGSEIFTETTLCKAYTHSESTYLDYENLLKRISRESFFVVLAQNLIQ